MYSVCTVRTPKSEGGRGEGEAYVYIRDGMCAVCVINGGTVMCRWTDGCVLLLPRCIVGTGSMDVYRFKTLLVVIDVNSR